MADLHRVEDEWRDLLIKYNPEHKALKKIYHSAQAAIDAYRKAVEEEMAK